MLHDLAAGSSGSSLGTFLPLVLIVVAFYFLLIRPQRGRARQMQQVQASVTPGAQVMTTSGMFATVTGIDDEAVTLELAPGVHVRFLRGAISKVVPPAVAGTSADDSSAAFGEPPSGGSTIELPPDDRPPA